MNESNERSEESDEICEGCGLGLHLPDPVCDWDCGKRPDRDDAPSEVLP